MGAEESKEERWKQLLEEEMPDAVEKMTEKVSEDPEAYQKYLKLQAKHPRCTAISLLWLMDQHPEEQEFHTLQEWNNRRRYIIAGSEGTPLGWGMVRQEDGLTNDHIEWVFGSEQTYVSKRLRQKSPEQRLDGERLEAGVRTLLELSPVEVIIGPEGGAEEIRYDISSQQILVPPGTDMEETFRGLAREILQAKVHQGMEGYERETFQMDAESLSWMLCQRYGLPCPKPDLNGLAEQNIPWSLEERFECLGALSQIYSQIEKEVTRNTGREPISQRVEQAKAAITKASGKQKTLEKSGKTR